MNFQQALRWYKQGIMDAPGSTVERIDTYFKEEYGDQFPEMEELYTREQRDDYATESIDEWIETNHHPLMKEIAELKQALQSKPSPVPESVEGEFVGQDQSWYCGRKVRTYRGNGVVTGNKTNDTDFIRVDLGYGDHQHWYKEELELITDEPALQSKPSMPETKEEIEYYSDNLNAAEKRTWWGSIMVERDNALKSESELRSINESLRNERNQIRQQLEDMEAEQNKACSPNKTK